MSFYLVYLVKICYYGYWKKDISKKTIRFKHEAGDSVLNCSPNIHHRSKLDGSSGGGSVGFFIDDRIVVTVVGVTGGVAQRQR